MDELERQQYIEARTLLQKHNLRMKHADALIWYYEMGFPEKYVSDKLGYSLMEAVLYYKTFGSMLESEYQLLWRHFYGGEL